MLGISEGVAVADSEDFMCFSHIVLSSPTLLRRSFRARLDSASLSLLAASSSCRLAMLSSGMSSLWLLQAWERKVSYFIIVKGGRSWVVYHYSTINHRDRSLTQF